MEAWKGHQHVYRFLFFEHASVIEGAGAYWFSIKTI